MALSIGDERKESRKGMAQVTIHQGIRHEINVTDIPESMADSTICAALYNKATNKRYVAERSGSVSTALTFAWESGLKAKSDTDKELIIDPDQPNGTASMDIGVYDLEIFSQNRSMLFCQPNYANVVASNVMAVNTADGEE